MQSKRAIFYNGFRDLSDGYKAARKVGKDLGAIVYDKALPDAFYRTWASPGKETGEQQDIRISALSAAFAYSAAGTVYVLTPKGTTFRSGTVWSDYELPLLTRNPYVHEIVRIDYEERKTTKQMKKTTLWKGPRGPEEGTWPPRVDSKYKAIFELNL